LNFRSTILRRWILKQGQISYARISFSWGQFLSTLIINLFIKDQPEPEKGFGIVNLLSEIG